MIKSFVEQEILEATGHQYGERIVVIEPTDEQEGLGQQLCSNCECVLYEYTISMVLDTKAFEQACEAIHNATGADATFEAICNALKEYNLLSNAEKRHAETDYTELNMAIKRYNLEIRQFNENHSNATAIALGIIISISLASACLYFVVKKFL